MKTTVLSVFCIIIFSMSSISQTTQEVYLHHEKALIDHDLKEILKDYSEESVLITPDGKVYKGTEAIKATFEYAFKDVFPRNMKLNKINFLIEGEAVFMVYSVIDKDSGEVVMPFAVDTFIIRNGKIQYQTVASSTLPPQK